MGEWVGGRELREVKEGEMGGGRWAGSKSVVERGWGRWGWVGRKREGE